VTVTVDNKHAALVAGILDQYGMVVGVTDAAERPST
jgi:hypothetical protein